MSQHNDSNGVSALIRHTAGMAELAADAGHSDRKHTECLPYPDNNFTEISNEQLQKDDKFIVTHIYNDNGHTFIPNIPVHVKSINAKNIHSSFTEFLNPYLYCITIEHGDFEWTIYKRYRDFHDLHKSLAEFVETEIETSINSMDEIQDEDNENPCFPTRNDRLAFINNDSVQERCTILVEYLNKILKHPKFRNHPATREFFGVSCMSFVYGISVSTKEGYLLKRAHNDYYSQYTLFRLPFFNNLRKFYHDRKWVVIKDSYITYIRPDTCEVRFPMLVDCVFDFQTGRHRTGTYQSIKIRNSQRSLVVKCRSTRDCEEWTEHLLRLKEQGKCFINPEERRFNSYAPVRNNQLAYWFINGKSYMEAVAKALLTAKEEVFITDWWLSPEIMLIRPSDDETFRLDLLLGRIADAGVRVYVLIYKGVPLAINVNSLYTKQVLTSISKKGNIKVIRHPDHYPKNGVFLWSHHEKMVVIDQKIAFVGGMDLCYGRWDDECMRLVDLGDENDKNLKMPSEIAAEIAPVSGSSGTLENAKTIPPQLNEQVDSESINSSGNIITTMNTSNKINEDMKSLKQTHANRPRHHMKTNAKNWIESKLTGTDTDEDHSINASISSRISIKHYAKNIRRHKRYTHKRRKIAKIIRKAASEEDSNDDDEEEEIEEQQSFPTIPYINNPKHRYFIGKDYCNLFEKDFDSTYVYRENDIDRRKVPRMPWHDEALVVFGQVARDVARHFIQRWNIHKCKKYPNNPSYPFLLPKSYDDDEDLTVKNWKDFIKNKPFKVNAQCVRSLGPWSGGIRIIESSVHNAYIQMIDAAQYYIYIENPFFISIAQDQQVRNDIGDTLYRRIERAHKLNEKFRIYIIIPLLPPYDDISSIQITLFFTMRSISKGDNSLFKRLEKAGIPANNYISFFSLRTHDILMGYLVTEMIYVHSKLMIIDDRMAICGSANLYDRSLLGHRDSEFCIVINDHEEEEEGLFNGEKVRIGKFCSSWRKKLFAMMLGIHIENPNNIDISDPISDEFYNYFCDVARKNALIYEEVFSTLPTNRVRKFNQIKEYTHAPMKDTDPIRAKEKLKDIQGFIVEYPLYFLDDENYLPSFHTRAGLVPCITWT